jgi:hypothetical protein
VIALIVAGVVALFGIVCYIGFPSILAECEAERVDLIEGPCDREMRRFNS